MKYNYPFTLIFILFLLSSSCKKKEVTPCPSEGISLKGSTLVLNEGLFQQNNASLSLISGTNVELNFFENQAGRPLGDTGNDMKRYGGKIYIVVNVSSTIEVIDASNGLSIKQISMIANGQAKQPRHMDFHGGKVFISCYDGFVDVLDTNSLTITNRISVGANPDQLRVHNDKLYVSNSGGLNFPNVDSTVSVVSLTSLSEIKKITVGKNPGSIAVSASGDVFVISRGDFGAIPSRMHRIETIGDTKVEDYSFEAAQLTEFNGDLLVLENDGVSSLRKFNTTNNNLESEVLLSLSGITTPYKILFDDVSQKIFVLDANGYVNQGYVNSFTATGTFIEKVKVGLIPTSIIQL